MSDAINLLVKGKYVFFTELKQQQGLNVMVPEFSAKGLSLIEKEGVFSAEVLTFDISNLISKRSVYVNSEKSIEAHKLYTWPVRLGDPKAWAESKHGFFGQYLLNHPIEILSLQEEGHFTWKYITEACFKDTASQIQESYESQEVMSRLVFKEIDQKKANHFC